VKAKLDSNNSFENKQCQEILKNGMGSGWHQMVIGFPKLTHMFWVFSAFSTSAQQHQRETYG
jgi:hypothetical protein